MHIHYRGHEYILAESRKQSQRSKRNHGKPGLMRCFPKPLIAAEEISSLRALVAPVKRRRQL
jgi:hypothetical protein